MYYQKLNFWLIFFSIFVIAIAPSFPQEGNPKLTEIWEPVLPVVTPGAGTAPPSDAVALFNGRDLSQWQNENGGAARWKVEKGVMTVVNKTGNIYTKQAFGDCQLHLEWKIPAMVVGEGQGRGNSGVFLQSRYEIHILDSYNNQTYSNGQAGSIYKQSIPLVNVCRKPGEWQTFDVVFTAPRFAEDGTLQKPAFITVFQNGVLVQNHVELRGSTAYIGEPTYQKHNLREPLMLQDHGSPVSFRNIWIREMP
jgi:hypothetical protein